jgi:hypothetical protein
MLSRTGEVRREDVQSMVVENTLASKSYSDGTSNVLVQRGPQVQTERSSTIFYEGDVPLLQ